MRLFNYLFAALLSVALVLGSNGVYAQKPVKKGKPKNGAAKKGSKSTRKDIIRIKAPAIQGAKKPVPPKPLPDSEPDWTTNLEADSVPAKKGDMEFYFPAWKDQSLVSEDTGFFGDGEVSLVEISEEVKVDSTWVRIAEYFSTWDSKRINPYHISKDEFDEPELFTLYDTTVGRNWSMPLRHTQVNSRFGFRGYRFHFGTDLELDVGDTIRAAFDGIVRAVGWDGGGYGNYIVLRHYNGLETLYGHLSRIDVESQQIVRAGDMIGEGGSTGRSSGPHLHYEVRYQGNAINTEEVYDYGRWAIASQKFLLTPDMFKYMRTRSRKVVYHRVRPGDTMYSVAHKFGMSVTKLAKLNGMKKGAGLRAGKRLRVR